MIRNQQRTPATESLATAKPNELISARRLEIELEEATAALATLDADRLEAIEARIRTVTAAQLAASPTVLPQLLMRHTTLGQMVEVTAANLKVLVSVLNLEMRPETR